MPTAIPTASSNGFRVLPVGTGKQYANLSAFSSYLNSLDFSTEQGVVCAEVYENQNITGLTFNPRNVSDTQYCIIRAVPGLDVNVLNAGNPLDYGSAGGIELTANTSAYALVNNGVIFTGFKMHVIGSGTGDRAALLCTKYAQTGGNSKWQGFYFNRFLLSSANRNAIEPGNSGGFCTVFSCLVVGDNGSPTALSTSGYNTMIGNTFARLDGNHNLGGMFADCGEGRIQGNVLINTQLKSGNFNGTYAPVISDNYTNVATATDTGFTVITDAAHYVNNVASDWRPVSGGLLIAASKNDTYMITTPDLFGANRGLNPDAGAVQLVPAPPAPGGAVISQPDPDGQTLTITFSTTGSPSSAKAQLVPAASNPNGATLLDGSTTLGTNNGSATFTGFQPGNYTVNITVTNPGGTIPITGTRAVNVIGIGGTPMADSAPAGGPAPAPAPAPSPSPAPAPAPSPAPAPAPSPAPIVGGNVVVYDTFTDTPGTALLAHTGEVGATWTGAAMTIDSTGARVRGAGTTVADTFASGLATTDGEFIDAVVDVVSVTGTFGFWLRGDGAGHGYNLFCDGTAVELDRYLPGSLLPVGTRQPLALSVSTGNTARMKAFAITGGVQVDFTWNGTTISFQDTGAPITKPGANGIRFRDSASDTAGVHISSFKVTDGGGVQLVSPSNLQRNLSSLAQITSPLLPGSLGITGIDALPTA